MEEQKLAMRVSTITMIGNLLLSFFKLLAGLLAHSGAMISDAVHSASDVFSTIIVMIGVTMAGKKSDTDHQYGHDRMECVASIILAIVLAATGIGIGITGIEEITSVGEKTILIPGRLALIAALVSIVVKEWMYWYTRAAGKKINSGALMADAWHHRSDALSSVGAFIGILGAQLGYPVADPIASVVICLFIEKAAFDIFKDSMDKMVDKSCSEEINEQMREVILSQSGVTQIDVLRTRLFGAKVYVDVEFSTEGDRSLYEAHAIAENVHDAIEKNFPNVKHCMVHVNPLKTENVQA